jgi:outer membrane biosynthesis protein TonB
MTPVTNTTVVRLPQSQEQQYDLTERDKILWNAPAGHCSLESTQLIPTSEVYKLVSEWVDAATNDASPRPRLLKDAQAMHYPDQMLMQGIPGAVLVLLSIDDRGRVAAANAICATRPEFIPAAVAAARSYVFEPMQLNGKTVRAVAFQPFNFEPGR